MGSEQVSQSKLNSSAITTTSYNDTTGTLGTTYYYWVTAVNTAGESGYGGPDSGYRKK
jgi:hypothetical protein